MSSRVGGRLTQRPIKDVTTHGTVDRYISHCTYCIKGIFSNHKYHWVGGDGLVHLDCEDPRGENEATNPKKSLP